MERIAQRTPRSLMDVARTAAGVGFVVAGVLLCVLWSRQGVTDRATARDVLFGPVVLLVGVEALPVVARSRFGPWVSCLTLVVLAIYVGAPSARVA